MSDSNTQALKILEDSGLNSLPDNKTHRHRFEIRSESSSIYRFST